MAKLIPPTPPPSASPAVMRMFLRLRSLDEDYVVRHLVGEESMPQFFIIWRERFAFLLKVAATNQELAETVLNPSLFSSEESLTLEQIRSESNFGGLLEGLPEDLPVRCLVVFPNVDEGTIDQIERQETDSGQVTYLGLRQTSSDHLAARLESLAQDPVSEPVLMRLRAKFDHGSRVQGPSVRVPLLQQTVAKKLEPTFLDLDQELLAKVEIELPPEAERLARQFETRLITGPAGCGKSLVLLHRALFAAKLNRRSRLLILTHNKPINAELRRRAVATAPEGVRIRWLNFFRWARMEWPGFPERILPQRKVETRLARLMAESSEFGRLTAAFVAEELGYLRDLGIGSLDEYLALKRKGRSIGLTVEKKKAVWQLLVRYRAELADEGASDWHEVALGFHQFARERREGFSKYDFIFIDEAQFFAKIWFGPVLSSLASGGQLFLAADPTQGFLKRRESWLEAGIDVRGRSTRLSKPYRSTRAILEFARDLIERRRHLHPDDTSDDLDPPSVEEIASTEEEGEVPRLVGVASPQEAIGWVVREVVNLRAASPHVAGQVLILHASSFAAPELVRALRQRLGSDQVEDLNIDDQRGENPFCAVSNLRAATGLEAAIVFLLGVDELLEAEDDVRLDEQARSELRADHTRLLYMACTRAGQRLVVVSDRLARKGW